MKFVPPPPASSIIAPLGSTQIGLSHAPAKGVILRTQPSAQVTVRFQSTFAQAAFTSIQAVQTVAFQRPFFTFIWAREPVGSTVS